MKKTMIAALTVVLAGSHALAHAHLTGATPANKAVVTAAPAALALMFSEDVALKFTGVTVTGPDGAPVATGAATLDPKDSSKLAIPLTGKLGAGAYKIVWHALSADGHKTHGTYMFTVK